MSSSIRDMEPIRVSCNVVTGRIEVDSDGWAGDDPRWEVIARPDGSNADAAEIAPWAEDEDHMERADDAIRDILGLLVGGWADEGDVQYATVTGLAA